MQSICKQKSHYSFSLGCDILFKCNLFRGSYARFGRFFQYTFSAFFAAFFFSFAYSMLRCFLSNCAEGHCKRHYLSLATLCGGECIVCVHISRYSSIWCAKRKYDTQLRASEITFRAPPAGRDADWLRKTGSVYQDTQNKITRGFNLYSSI